MKWKTVFWVCLSALLLSATWATCNAQQIISPFVVAPAAAPGFTLMDSLVAHYTFSAAATMLRDTSGKAHHLTGVGTVAANAGKIDSGYQAAGSPNLLYCADTTNDFRMNDVDFTVAFWGNSNTDDWGCIVGNDGGADTAQWAIHTYGGTKKLYVDAKANGNVQVVVQSDSIAEAGKWSFVVAWYDAATDTMHLQVNNAQIVVGYLTGGMNKVLKGEPLKVGGNGTNFTGGTIDELSIWRRQLSATERATLYNSGSGKAFGTW